MIPHPAPNCKPFLSCRANNPSNIKQAFHVKRFPYLW